MAKIDLRITIFLAAVMVTIPLIHPIPPPIGIHDWVRDAYNVIESLPDGSYVYWSEGWRGGGDMKDEFIAIARHLMRKHMKVIFNCVREEEVPLTQELWVINIFGSSPEKWPLYGKEFVNLGLIVAPGAVYTMVDDIRAIVKTDFYGNSLTDYDKLPMMKDIKGFRDCKLFVEAGMGLVSALREMMPGMKFVSPCATGHWMSTIEPLYRAKIVDGALHGLRGAAEYEILMGQPAGASVLIVSALALGAYVTVILAAGVVYHVYSVYSRKGRVE